MLKELTAEQEEILVKNREEWIAKFFDTKSIDEPAFREGVNWVYNDLLQKPSPEIIYCDSWESGLTTIGLYCNPTLTPEVEELVNKRIGISQADLENLNLSKEHLKKIYESARENFNQTSTYLNTYSNYGWVTFYDFFEKIGILDNELFRKYKKLIAAGAFYVYEFEKFVFAIQPPQNISRNEEGQLHNVTGKAVEFSDGVGYYYVNGREMPDHIFEQELTFEKFQQERNEDIKAGMVTIIKERDGNEGLLKFLKAEMVDEKHVKHSEDYSEVIRLYKTSEVFSFLQDRHGNMGQPYCWLEIKCPSTGSTYLIDSSADFTDALEAAKFARPTFVPQELTYQWANFAN